MALGFNCIVNIFIRNGTSGSCTRASDNSVATTPSQVESLEAEITPNDFSFGDVCQAGTSFDDCISEACGSVSFNGDCIISFCGNEASSGGYSFDNCMEEVCNDFSFGEGSETDCPVENSCSDADGSAALCEEEVCADTTLTVCNSYPSSTLCDPGDYSFDDCVQYIGGLCDPGDYSFDDCVEYISSMCDPGDYSFDECVEQVCQTTTSNGVDETPCLFGACLPNVMPPLQTSECQEAVCEVEPIFTFCNNGNNVPLAVQTNEVTAVSHTSTVMLMMVMTLLSTASLATNRQ